MSSHIRCMKLKLLQKVQCACTVYSGLADYVVTVDCCLLCKMYVHYVP